MNIDYLKTVYYVIANHYVFFAWIAFCYLLASWRVNPRFIQFFQQEEYDNARFLRWWINTKSFERFTPVAALLVFSALYIPSLYGYVIAFFMALVFAAAGLLNGVRESKKKLVYTARVKRILSVACVVQVIFLLLLCMFAFKSNHLLAPFSIPIVIQLIPLSFVVVNILLSPVESSIQNRYLNEAKAILSKIDPVVIGITGSYGKTSTKHILDHILNCHQPALATPGSVNTMMGITRIIRERLKLEHRFFIVEMGAYGIGSIRRLCGFTPPRAALVTAVGLAHYERFKSVETVAEAKSELPQAVPAGGVVVLNGDNPHCRGMAKKTKAKCYFYGEDASQGKLDCRLFDCRVLAEGTAFSLEYGGKTYSITMPVYGRHQAFNAAGAFLAAVSLGVPPITAVAALQSLAQVNHRLVVTKDSSGVITIDDAYNSNPTGFENALEVLKELPGNRKILITPGMVELGEKEVDEHRRIAAFTVKSCDLVCIIASQRIPSFHEGLLQNGFPAHNIHEFKNLSDARQWLSGELKSGDVVLFENDLPDLYESSSAF